MTLQPSRVGAALLACLALAVAGCTTSAAVSGNLNRSSRGSQLSSKAVAGATLTAFRSCGDALTALRTAAEASVTSSGLPDGVGSPLTGDATSRSVSTAPQGAPEAAAAGSAAGSAAESPAAAAPAFSGTNDYQANVDEPDLVKTDGRRIVIVTAGTLDVIDAASRLVTGRLDLASAGFAGGPANLLLSGDRALLITPGEGMVGVDGPAVRRYGPRFLLIDLAGQPRVTASYTIEGSLIDARLAGSVVRIVTASQPDIYLPAPASGASDAGRVAAYRAAAGQAGLDAWLPHFESSGSGGTIAGRVPCTAVSRPASYSGTNLLTVLTFDLSAASFGTGDPVSVAADGDTVYGTTSSLYVASGGMRPSSAVPEPSMRGPGVRQDTQIYRFDITQPGAPRYAASGAVPGYLVDQYAMSEWNGYLRVATTTGTSWAPADGRPAGAQTSSSAVYVLTTSGPVLRVVGQVTGLGSTERIYAVRFTGPVGYVVTFRQTDPLYTLDLSDPSRPLVAGALGLTGYSAYLHPISATRLIGIGQQADTMGHVLGTQLTLFDVSDLAAPARLDSYALAQSMSQAQSDPHAFLYWPADQLVVVPIQTYGPVTSGPAGSGTAPATPMPQSGALVLRIAGASITRTGFISQPQSDPYTSPIQRSLVIGQTLWTVSAAGLLASDLTTLRQQAWLPLSAAGNPYPERSAAAGYPAN